MSFQYSIQFYMNDIFTGIFEDLILNNYVAFDYGNRSQIRV